MRHGRPSAAPRTVGTASGIWIWICLWLLASLLVAAWAARTASAQTAIPTPAPGADAVVTGGGSASAGGAGFLPGEGFIIYSSDGTFKVRVGMQVGYKIEPVVRDGDMQNRSTFSVVRPALSGNLFKKWIKFQTSMELAANPPYLLESWVDVLPWKQIGLRAGQQSTPFSRHENFGHADILFPDNSPVAHYFWSGRDKGVTVLGTLGGDQVQYFAGAFGGSTVRQFTTIAGNYLFEGRVTGNPLGKVGGSEFCYITADGSRLPFRVYFTLQGYYGKIQDAVEDFNPTTFSYVAAPSGVTNKKGAGGVDLFIQSPRLVFFAEGYGGHTSPEGAASYTSVGVWAQIGFLLLPQTLDIAVRGNWLNPSTALSNDRFVSGELQLAYYIHSPNLILKLRYGYGDQQTPGAMALGAVPLAISAGRTQLVTLQFNIAL